jgi:hypothetical protein
MPDVTVQSFIDTFMTSANEAAARAALLAAKQGAYVVLSGTPSTTSTSFANIDADFKLAMEANKNYLVLVMGTYVSNVNTEGITVALNGPASPTLVAITIETHAGFPGASAVGNEMVAAYDTATVNTTGTAVGSYFVIQGLIRNGANAGDLFPRFKTETGTANSNQVNTGIMILQELA